MAEDVTTADVAEELEVKGSSDITVVVDTKRIAAHAVTVVDANMRILLEKKVDSVHRWEVLAAVTCGRLLAELRLELGAAIIEDVVSAFDSRSSPSEAKAP